MYNIEIKLLLFIQNIYTDSIDRHEPLTLMCQ